jgi:hypothetical protein
MNAADAVTGVITNPTLAVGPIAPEKFAWSAFTDLINGVTYSKTANETTFTAAHVVSATRYGVIDIYIDAAGAFLTVVPLATQAYTSAALAHGATGQTVTRPARRTVAKYREAIGIAPSAERRRPARV